MSMWNAEDGASMEMVTTTVRGGGGDGGIGDALSGFSFRKRKMSGYFALRASSSSWNGINQHIDRLVVLDTN